MRGKKKSLFSVNTEGLRENKPRSERLILWEYPSKVKHNEDPWRGTGTETVCPPASDMLVNAAQPAQKRKKVRTCPFQFLRHKDSDHSWFWRPPQATPARRTGKDARPALSATSSLPAEL